MKKYYESTRSQKLEYQKQYAQQNKQKLQEYKEKYKKIKVLCSCGCTVSKASMSRHVIKKNI
jgi:hypothetical protein